MPATWTAQKGEMMTEISLDFFIKLHPIFLFFQVDFWQPYAEVRCIHRLIIGIFPAEAPIPNR